MRSVSVRIEENIEIVDDFPSETLPIQSQNYRFNDWLLDIPAIDFHRYSLTESKYQGF
jgi:hypothetical protein